jgi:ABC-type transport system substrate-binding protein
MESALRLEPIPYDAKQAKRLLAEAGYPGGFDAGDLTPMPPFTTMGEAVASGGRRSSAGSSRRPRRRRGARRCASSPS